MISYSYEVIIPASGRGERMNLGYNKLLYKLNGRTIIERTVSLFAEDNNCHKIIVVASDCDINALKANCSEWENKLAWVYGGKTRQESVRKGLEVISANREHVIVHDGARPLVKKEYFQKVIHRSNGLNGGCILAVPVKDTVKRVKAGKVISTLERDELWNVQTPQAFSSTVLRKAHEWAGEEQVIGNDDATLVELAGYMVGVELGDYNNIKITTLEDIPHAEAILKSRGEH